MSGTPFVPPRFIPVSSTGRPYPAAKLYFYRAGTTTLATVYTDSALSVPSANPLTANSAGMFNAVYLDPSAGYDYKTVLQTSAGVQLWSEDNIPAGPDSYPPGDIRNHGGTVGGSLNTALQAALDSGEPVVLPVGSYTLSVPVSLPDGSSVDATGSTITLSGSARFTLGNNTEWKGGTIVGPGAAYSANNHAFYCSGTRNGAGVAPTLKSNVRIDGAHISGFGDSGVYLAYCDDVRVTGCTIEDVGYCGVQVLSGSHVEVSGNFISGLTGETSSGELNAYGVTFTADNTSTDFVRDPHSSYCRAIGNTLEDIPTWHALDAHAGQYCDFIDNLIVNCRRGVILTSRNSYGSNNCRAIGNTIVNTYTESATNSNATEKRSTAIWDIGYSSSIVNSNNEIRDNYIEGHGQSKAYVGAIITQYTKRGEIANNRLSSNYTCGIAIQDYTTDFTVRGNTIVDTHNKGTGAGGVTNSPVGLRFFGSAGTFNFNDILLIGNTFAAQDSSIDTYVQPIGVSVDDTASKSFFAAGNAFNGVTTKWSFAGSTAGVTGDVPLSFTATGTGFSGSVTGTVSYARNGNVVTLDFPQISGTSNTTAFTFTGLPSQLYPTANRLCIVRGQDNGSVGWAVARIEAAGTITLLNGVAAGSWTNSGTKAIEASSVTYSL